MEVTLVDTALSIAFNVGHIPFKELIYTDSCAIIGALKGFPFKVSLNNCFSISFKYASWV